MWTVEDGINVLRDKGAKITAQRIAILQKLEGRTDHPSADTLYRELSSEYSTMSVATLYSTAQLLAEAGLIKILSIDDKRVYFDPTTDTHGHFLCRSCGKLFDIPVDEADIFKSAVTERENIAQIERTEIFFYGLCTDCLKI
ncbi:MAG: Fur family transcriptional regulator [Synergistaceae bacterium]|nr:Fur family transcriptional regulator [Synergistaceae bacterium]